MNILYNQAPSPWQYKKNAPTGTKNGPIGASLG
jgi:hypothetical protein